jgi:hypothetical protein
VNDIPGARSFTRSYGFITTVQSMLNRPRHPLALGVILLVTGCNADHSTSPESGIAVDALISDASIGAPETATITYRLRNLSRVTRTVAVRCNIADIRIDDEHGANVFPANRSIICTAEARLPEVLAPGQELTRTFTVSGEAGSSFIKLPPGRYTAEAEFGIGLSKRRYTRLRADGPSFQVTP